jgi:hypothetical protein
VKMGFVDRSHSDRRQRGIVQPYLAYVRTISFSIRAFREKIKEWAEAYRNGVDVNVEAECHAARKAIRNIHPGPTRQVLGWASRVARIAGLAPDAGMQLGLMAAEGVFDGLNNKLYRRQLREHEWLFFTTRLVDRATM